RARLEAVALVLCAADLVGVGRAALDDAVRYVKDRRQFGVPVGSFQAVKHMAADAHCRLSAAESLMLAAAWRLDATDDALTSCRRAKAVAGEAAKLACET